MSTENTHFTAWITTDPTCLPDDRIADVSILPDRLDERGNWSSEGAEPLLILSITRDFMSEHRLLDQDGYWDILDVQRAAQLLMENVGWRREGYWSEVPTGMIADAVLEYPGHWRVILDIDGDPGRGGSWVVRCSEHGVIFNLVTLDGDAAAAQMEAAADRHRDDTHEGRHPLPWNG